VLLNNETDITFEPLELAVQEALVIRNYTLGPSMKFDQF